MVGILTTVIFLKIFVTLYKNWLAPYPYDLHQEPIKGAPGTPLRRTKTLGKRGSWGYPIPYVGLCEKDPPAFTWDETPPYYCKQREKIRQKASGWCRRGRKSPMTNPVPMPNKNPRLQTTFKWDRGSECPLPVDGSLTLLPYHLTVDFHLTILASPSPDPLYQPVTLHNTTLGGQITCKQMMKKGVGKFQYVWLGYFNWSVKIVIKYLRLF